MAGLNSGKRLSAMDANYLYSETQTAPMHYLFIAVVEGELTLAKLAEGIEANLPKFPRFTQKVVPHRFRLRRPSWKPDPLFHLDRHLFEVQVAPPGTDDELLPLGAKICGGVMDRSKPLWEMHLVHGLSGDRSAVIMKMHHCTADEEAALESLKVIVKSSAISRSGEQVSEQASERRNDVAESNDHTPLIRSVTASLGQSARRGPLLLNSLTTRTKPLLFNRTPSGERTLCRCEFSSVEARVIGATCGGTVTDVMLSVLAGGVRRYLKSDQHAKVSQKLRVMVSLRPNMEHEDSPNLATVHPIDIPLDVNDPLECLRYVTARSREVSDARGAERKLPLFPYDILLTNFSSLQLPSYIFGRRALGIYPFPTIPYGFRFSCGLLERDEKVNLMLTMEAQAIPNAQFLKLCLEQSFAKLRDAAGVTELETFGERLQQGPGTNRYELLSDYVCQQVATVLQWEDDQPPDLQQGFFDLGMDSLSALKLKDRLQTGFGTELPFTLIFETPNIETLTNYLATQVLGWNDLNREQPEAIVTHTETPHDLLAKIQDLSDDEVKRLLANTSATSSRA